MDQTCHRAVITTHRVCSLRVAGLISGSAEGLRDCGGALMLCRPDFGGLSGVCQSLFVLKDQFSEQSTESGVAGLGEEFVAQTGAVSERSVLHFKVCALASLSALTAWEGLVGKARCGIFWTKVN